MLFAYTIASLTCLLQKGRPTNVRRWKPTNKMETGGLPMQQTVEDLCTSIERGAGPGRRLGLVIETLHWGSPNSSWLAGCSFTVDLPSSTPHPNSSPTGSQWREQTQIATVSLGHDVNTSGVVTNRQNGNNMISTYTTLSLLYSG